MSTKIIHGNLDIKGQTLTTNSNLEVTIDSNTAVSAPISWRDCNVKITLDTHPDTPNLPNITFDRAIWLDGYETCLWIKSNAGSLRLALNTTSGNIVAEADTRAFDADFTGFKNGIKTGAVGVSFQGTDMMLVGKLSL